jgi:hypothetical protein
MRKLQRVVEQHNGVLLSTEPEARGNEATLTVTVPDMTQASALASALRGTEGIEAAYAKPGEELP